MTAQAWDAEVLKSSTPVLVDFWAEWCGPCKMLGPTIDVIAEEYAGRLRVVKLNVDNEPSIAGKYAISSIPTLILFKNGEIAEHLVGLLPKQKIVEKVLPHI